MIWQGLLTRRPPAVPEGGPVTRRFAPWRPRPRWGAGPAPAVVIREPEAGWWRAQADLDDGYRGGPTTTVAVLRDDAAGTDAMLTRLVELAAADELLVVCGSASWARPGDAATVTGLRRRLPGRDVAGLRIGGPGTRTRRHAITLERALDAGSVIVVSTAPGMLHDVTAEISSLVRADRVLRVFGTPAGAGLHQVWRRETCIN